MKINCNIVEDLLPLYLDGACSNDSKAALDTHLAECESCRKKLERMRKNESILPEQKDDNEILLKDYAKKIKRHRHRVVLLSILICVVSACVLALLFLTFRDMRIRANPHIPSVEDGVYNLTESDLETTTEEIGQYILFTNYEKIKVQIQKGADYSGEVYLWTADYDEPILYGKVDPATNSCTFQNLSSAYRYRISLDEEAETFSVSVSDGRDVSFWNSLKSVLSEIFID